MAPRTPTVSGRLPLDNGAIHGLAVVELDGEPVFVCAVDGETLWSWRPSRDEWREHAFDLAFGEDDAAAEEFGYGFANEFDRLAAVVHDGRIIVAAGDDEQPPALWDLDTGRLVAVGDVDEPYSGAIAAIGGERPRVVTGSQYVGNVWRWDLTDLSEPTDFPRDVDFVQCLDIARVGDRTLLAIGEDGVTVRDLDTGAEVARLSTDVEWPGYDESDDELDDDEVDDRLFAVSIGDLDGRPVVVGGSAEPARVFVWDLATTELVAKPLSGHEGPVNDLVTVTVDGRPLAITGAEDGTVRVWDLAAGQQLGEAVTDHSARVSAVRVFTFDGSAAVATAGYDGVIRIWNLADLL